MNKEIEQKKYPCCIYFVKNNYGYKIEAKNHKHYQKLKFRFEQSGYIEKELSKDDDEYIIFA